MRVLNYDECAERCDVVRRTWDRIIENAKGPPTVEISPRRRGVIDVDFEAWLLKRRRLPPGWADAPQLTASGVPPEQADNDAFKNDEGEDESKARRSKGPTRRAAGTSHRKAALRSNRVRTEASSR
jgi:hypothetical protein